MKKLLNLQLFAEDETGTGAAATEATETATAGKTEAAAAGSGTETKETKATEEKKYSDKDLDEIIGRKFAKWQKDHERKVEAAASEAKKLAEMNAQQKAEYERDKLQKELEEERKQNAEYKRKETLSEMSKTARKMLSDDGISVSDEVLSMLVTTDAEQTKSAVEGFAKAYKEAVENGVKERLRGKVPTTSTGSTTPITEIERRIKKYD